MEEELLLESLPPVVCNEVFIAPLFPLTENIFLAAVNVTQVYFLRQSRKTLAEVEVGEIIV